MVIYNSTKLRRNTMAKIVRSDAAAEKGAKRND